MHKFRVHHILCTNLYRGYGYDNSFCKNMSYVVKSLRENQNQEVCLVSEPDMICKDCPNLLPNDRCYDENNHVKIKDEELLSPLHLELNRIYTYQELLEHAKRYLTKEVFERSCQNCKWYKEGICKFEDFDF